MPKRHADLRGWLIPCILLGTLTYALAEEITLTTYYPSPRGVYSELRVGSGGPFPAPTGTLHVLKPADDGAAAFRVDDEDADASPFIIGEQGNVGIGTTGPTAKLGVEGSISLETATSNPPAGKGIYWRAGGDNTWGAIVRDFSSGRLAIDSQVGTPLVLNSNGTSGNVGIGTTSPSQRLEVNGNINIPAGNVYMSGGAAGQSNTITMCGGCSCADGFTACAHYQFRGGILINSFTTTTPCDCGGGSSVCVVAGTAIRMADGTSKPIERISVGESVLGYAFDQERVEPVEVLERLQHAADHHPVLIVMTAGDATVTLTADHRVWTSDGWKRAVDLAVGDVVFISGQGGLQQTAVSSVTPQASTLPLHTIRTRTENYLANGVLIHTE